MSLVEGWYRLPQELAKNPDALGKWVSWDENVNIFEQIWVNAILGIKRSMVYCIGMYTTQENLENIAGNRDRYDNYFSRLPLKSR